MAVDYKVIDDFDALLNLEGIAREALSESRFSYAQFSSKKFRQRAETVSMYNKTNGVLAAYHNDIPYGLVYCTAGEVFVASNAIISSVTLFYVRIKIRETMLGGRVANQLMNGLVSWSKMRGCREILFHANFGESSEKVHRFVKKRGFRTVGGSYAREI